MSTDHSNFLNLLHSAGRAAYNELTPDQQGTLRRAGRAAYGTLKDDQRQAVRDFGVALRTLSAHFGDDPGMNAVIYREFGVSFLKKVSRGVKKVGKAIVKSPIIKAAAGVVAVVYPPVGVPLTAALAVADKAISMAKSPDKKLKALGQKIIKGTLEQAKINPDAARGAELLRKVAATKALPQEVQLKVAAAKEVKLRKAVSKANAVDSAAKYNGFIVTRNGQIIPGTQLLKIAGDIVGCY